MINPFLLKNDIDNNLRPYTSGIREHNGSIAVLTLYSGDPNAVTSSTINEDTAEYVGSKNRQYVQAILPKVENQRGRDMVSANRSLIPTLKNDHNGFYIGMFNNFSLVEVSEAKDQIVKLHQNFGGSWNLFFFGDTPSIYSFNGIFIDTWEYPYYQEFMTMYDKYLAGRKCVENGFKMKIAYDGKIVGGYLMNVKSNTSADNPSVKSFSFTVIITDENFMRSNAIVSGKQITGASGFNQLNNSHRIVDQYPGIITTDYADTVATEYKKPQSFAEATEAAAIERHAVAGQTFEDNS